VIPRLHLVTDDRVLDTSGFPKRARAMAEAGGERVALHLRGPGLSGRRLWEVGVRMREACEGTGALFLVNDRVDLALVLGARGAHLGERSLPPRAARRILGDDALLGRSVHGADEAAALAGAAMELDALDFLMVGTIWTTATHPGRPGAGTERVREVREAAPDLPLIGIGGVTPERVPELLAAGAQGAAVLGAVWDADDPAAAVAALLMALEGGRSGTPGPLKGSHS
jgi:thiamine-phosphate diphosphorylase